MNKKLIIGICAGAAALILIIVGIIAVTTDLFSFNPSEDGSTDSTSQTENSGTNSTPGNSSTGKADSSGVVIEKGGITIGSVSGKAGDTVTVPVKLSSNPGITAFVMNFKYDPAVLTYSSYKDGDIIPGIMVNPTDGTIGILGDADNDFTNNGTIINLVFKINKDAGAGQSDITLKVNSGEICNYNEESIIPKVTNGSVTVK